LPNIHGKSLTTPVGRGAAYGSFFAGIGGTDPAPYADKGDGALGFGIGVGNPVKNLGLQVSIASLDLSSWDRYALNLKVHRYLGASNSIAIGVENLTIQASASPTDSDASYFIVFSQGVQDCGVINRKSNKTKLHYSIGIGNGRFRDKSRNDIYAGKGKHGTTIFGNVAYELFNELNVICDWNGVNLNAGVSKAISLGDKAAMVLTVGVADLTDISGDGARLIGGVGAGIML